MDVPATKLPALAFEIFRDFGSRASSVRGQKLLMACSGGLDSVVLVDVLVRLRTRWNLELGIAHIHHGDSKTGFVVESRDGAAAFVKSLAAERGLEFFEVRYAGERELKSEDDLRRFRLQTLGEIVEKGGFDRVALAHHADDLLETRLMRIIRGTGPEGLRAMRTLTSKAVRPFLKFPKARLAVHAKQMKLSWLEDPSNKDETFFRNWVRNFWLPALEKERPGASGAIARSLDLLTGALGHAQELTTNEFKFNVADSKFNRVDFQQLTSDQKQVQLAHASRALGAKDFGHAKVSEVLKRLNRLESTRQKSTSFEVGGLLWKIDPQHILVVKLDTQR